MPVVALCGYTNAGKSTLMRVLSGADVTAEDRLFATLDPVTRRIAMPSGRVILLTDTVGFIQKLPTQLVASFRATLEELVEADLLLHVVDIAHPNVFEHVQAVEGILRELGAGSTIRLTVLNKLDLIRNSEGKKVKDLKAARAQIAGAGSAPPDVVSVSAVKRWGVADLRAGIEAGLAGELVPGEVSQSIFKRAG